MLSTSTHACVFALSLLANLPLISGRHDVTEEQYEKLAEEFESVGTVVGMATGTLIDRQWVLTAAHVAEFLDLIAPDKEQRFFVVNGKSYKIIEVHSPPDRIKLKVAGGAVDSEEANAHDIALLKLGESVSDVEPALIYSGHDEVGKEFVLVGCGSFWADGRTGASLAKANTMPRGKKRAGTNRFDRVALEGRAIVATFDAPSSSLVTDLEAGGFAGDSGCPMFLKVGTKWTVAGVGSMGDIGEDNLVGDYGDEVMATRVSEYAEWIRIETSGGPRR